MNKMKLSDIKRIFENSDPRKLEQARFAFLFEQGEKEDVLEELRKYQNEDGGFGHGIEPDFWLPASSPMATWAAGQILQEVNAEQGNEIVQAMISYLVHTIHPETGRWDSVLPANNDYPHAPWWHWQEGVQEQWMFNPSAELAAFLVNWSEKNSPAAQVGWGSIAQAVRHIMSKSEMDKHEINNYRHMVDMMQPYTADFHFHTDYLLKEVTEQVLMLAEKSINKDKSTWAEGYQALPLDFIKGPDDPLCARLGTLVEENLTFLLAQLSSEGKWDVSWNWGSYPEEFEVARKHWQGIITVANCKQLKAFGCLE